MSKLVKTGGYIYECPTCKCKQCGRKNENHTIEEMSKCQDMKRAEEIFNSDKSPLNFIIESAGSVRYSSLVCERCGKKFRFYRKEHTIYDKKAHKYHAWKQVCVDCINLESDAF